jgi:hypothetical protein
VLNGSNASEINQSFNNFWQPPGLMGNSTLWKIVVSKRETAEIRRISDLSLAFRMVRHSFGILLTIKSAEPLVELSGVRTTEDQALAKPSHCFFRSTSRIKHKLSKNTLAPTGFFLLLSL